MVNTHAGYITTEIDPVFTTWLATTPPLYSIAFADLTDYPADSVGALTNDGSGNLSWNPDSVMVYPGVGIALSNGTGWDASITDNSTDWNTAYGWGDHADAGYLTSLTGAVLTDQTTHQTIGATGERLSMLWVTDITCTNAISGSITGNAGTVTVADEHADTTCFPLFATAATGSTEPKTTSSLTLNSHTGIMGVNQIELTNTGTNNTSAVRYDQMMSVVGGLDWQQSVLAFINLVTSEPATPTLGNRYINTATGNSNVTSQGVTANYVYQWNGSSWTETIPNKGFTVWVEGLNTNYTFNTSWVEFGSTVSHNNTTGLDGGDTGEYYHLTHAEYDGLNIANWDTAYGWGNHADAGYLTSLTGAVLTDQTTGQTIGDTTNRLTKLWATDITVTNAITGSVTGNAGTVTVGDEHGDTTCFPLFATDATGSLSPKTTTGLTLNSHTGDLTTTGYMSNDNFNVSKHYTGFPDRTATSLGWVDGASGATRTLTLTATSDPIWVNGKSYIIDTLTKQIPDTTGLYWFWISIVNGTPTLQASTTNIGEGGDYDTQAGFDRCLVATVYWNTTTDKGDLSDERHWMGRDFWMHEYLHETVGARWYYGGTLTFPTESTFQLTQCEMYDEDIEHILTIATTCKIFYKNGDANWEWDTGNTTLKKVVSGAEKYNNGNTLSSVSNSNHFATWVFATNNVSEPFIVIIGQRQDVTLANARTNNTPSSLSYGTLPSAEMKLLYRVLWKQGTTAALEVADYRSVSNLPVANYTATDHTVLSNLGMSVSGHTWDANVDLGAFNLTTTGDITAGNLAISNWNTAYGWGDHDGLYLPIGGGTLTGDTTLSTDKKLNFRDSGIYIYSNTDGQLSIISDGYNIYDTGNEHIFRIGSVAKFEVTANYMRCYKELYMPNNTAILSRNVADGAWLECLKLNDSNVLQLGSAAGTESVDINGKYYKITNTYGNATNGGVKFQALLAGTLTDAILVNSTPSIEMKFNTRFQYGSTTYLDVQTSSTIAEMITHFPILITSQSSTIGLVANNAVNISSTALVGINLKTGDNGVAVDRLTISPTGSISLLGPVTSKSIIVSDVNNYKGLYALPIVTFPPTGYAEFGTGGTKEVVSSLDGHSNVLHFIADSGQNSGMNHTHTAASQIYSFWVYPHQTNKTIYLTGYSAAAPNYPVGFHLTNAGIIQYRDHDGNLANLGTYTANTWLHLTVSWIRNGATTYYINGIEAVKITGCDNDVNYWYLYTTSEGEMNLDAIYEGTSLKEAFASLTDGSVTTAGVSTDSVSTGALNIHGSTYIDRSAKVYIGGSEQYLSSSSSGYFDITTAMLRVFNNTNTTGNIEIAGYGNFGSYATLTLRNLSSPWEFWKMDHRSDATLQFYYHDGTEYSTALQLQHTAGTYANYLSLTNSIATAGPIIGVAGTDTNIDINLTTKGTGNINLNNNTILKSASSLFFYNSNNTGTSFINQDGTTMNQQNGAGVITLKALSGHEFYAFDSDTYRKTFAIADSVEDGINYFTVTNAATTSGPILYPVGTDTNIDINILPKGTGSINLTGPLDKITNLTKLISNFDGIYDANENFEGLEIGSRPYNWVHGATYDNVEIMEWMDGHQRVLKNTSTAVWNFCHTYKTHTKIGQFEFYARNETGVGSCFDIGQMPYAWLQAIQIHFAVDGHIYITNGVTNTNICDYTYDTWYHILVKFNCYTQLFTVYLNGTAIATNFGFFEYCKSVGGFSWTLTDNVGYAYLDALDWNMESYDSSLPFSGSDENIYSTYKTSAITLSHTSGWTSNGSSAWVTNEETSLFGHTNMLLLIPAADDSASKTADIIPIGRITYFSAWFLSTDIGHDYAGGIHLVTAAGVFIIGVTIKSDGHFYLLHNATWVDTSIHATANKLYFIKMKFESGVSRIIEIFDSLGQLVGTYTNTTSTPVLVETVGRVTVFSWSSVGFYVDAIYIHGGDYKGTQCLDWGTTGVPTGLTLVNQTADITSIDDHRNAVTFTSSAWGYNYYGVAGTNTTASCWVKIPDLTNGFNILEAGNADDGYTDFHFFRFAAGTTDLYGTSYNNAGWYNTSPITIAADTWYHLCWIITGGNLCTYYVNGVSIGTTVCTHTEQTTKSIIGTASDTFIMDALYLGNNTTLAMQSFYGTYEVNAESNYRAAARIPTGYTGTAQIISGIDGHSNCVQIDTLSHNTYDCEGAINKPAFTAQSSGTISWWWRASDIHVRNLFYTGNSWLYIGQTGTGKWEYFDGAVKTVPNVADPVENHWYHIVWKWDSASQHMWITIDGVSSGELNLYSTASITSFFINVGYVDQAVPQTAWIDAISCSWEAGYLENDNLFGDLRYVEGRNLKELDIFNRMTTVEDTYLPLAGGIMTGRLTLPNDANLYALNSVGTAVPLIYLSIYDQIYVGVQSGNTTVIVSGEFQMYQNIPFKMLKANYTDFADVLRLDGTNTLQLGTSIDYINLSKPTTSNSIAVHTNADYKGVYAIKTGTTVGATPIGITASAGSPTIDNTIGGHIAPIKHIMDGADHNLQNGFTDTGTVYCSEWIRMSDTSISTWFIRVHKSEVATIVGFYVDSSYLQYFDGTNFVNIQAMSNDTWYHIAISYNSSGTTTWYVNGIQVFTKSSGAQVIDTLFWDYTVQTTTTVHLDSLYLGTSQKEMLASLYDGCMTSEGITTDAIINTGSTILYGNTTSYGAKTLKLFGTDGIDYLSLQHAGGDVYIANSDGRTYFMQGSYAALILEESIASAANMFSVTNAATGNGPILAALGADTDIDINLTAKGAGKVKVGATGIGINAHFQILHNTGDDSLDFNFIG